MKIRRWAKLPQGAILVVHERNGKVGSGEAAESAESVESKILLESKVRAVVSSS